MGITEGRKEGYSGRGQVEGRKRRRRKERKDVTEGRKEERKGVTEGRV